jgi:hypothetical protein
MRNNFWFFGILVFLLAIGFGCGGGDDGTLNDSSGNPDGDADDDDGGDDDVNPPIDDDDTTDDDDDTAGDDDDDTPFEGDLSEFHIVPELIVEPAGFDVLFKASGTDVYGNEVTNLDGLSWASADEAIATVANDGTASTLTNGKTKITATWNNAGNGDTLTDDADLWVMGDVFVLDEGGYVALVDIGEDAADADYLGGRLDGTPHAMAITNLKYSAFVIEDSLSFVDLFQLDPDDLKSIKQANLSTNHIGTRAIQTEENVYFVEPTTDDLGIFHPLADALESSFIGGAIYLDEGSWPIDVSVNSSYIAALGGFNEPGGGTDNDGRIYFIEKVGSAMHAIVQVRDVEWPNPVRVVGLGDSTIVLSAGDGSGSQMDFYQGFNHGGAVQIAGEMGALAFGAGSKAWVGSNEAPEIVVFNISASTWEVDTDDPIVLPRGDRVIELKAELNRNEIWAANDDGEVFFYDGETLDLLGSYELAGFSIADIEIW